MPITFANIAGLWALLGIPAVLLIHFLQRQSRELPISTLFLLENLQRESVRGRKFDRLKNSVPLWLQLLAVLILTWLLMQPRWTRPDSVQRIAIVLDSSASMRAFQDSILTELNKALPPISRNASQVEYHVLESHLEGKTLYSGASLADLLETIEAWEPFRTAHDPGPALRVGRSLAGTKGTLIFVTDHENEDLKYDAKILSVGEVIPNVGFAGLEVDTSGDAPVWRAMVKNYAKTPQTREWFLTAGKQRTETRKISLQAGETRTLQGKFPGQSAAVTLQLEPDRFDQDDQLPIVIPRPKELRIATMTAPNLDKSFARVLASLENVVKPDDSNPPDLFLSSYDPVILTEQPDVAIIFLNQKDVTRHFFNGPIVSGNHPLVEGVNWQGLIARNSPGIPMDDDDRALLWQGERTLIFLREKEGKFQLFLNFDITSSNAEGLPAYIVLLHRFVEDLRSGKVTEETANLEIHQTISVAHRRGDEAEEITILDGGETGKIPLNQARHITAPDEPGFFTISQGKDVLLRGAAHFADTREADFTDATSSSALSGVESAAVQEQTEADHWWQLWVLGLILIALLSWFYIHRPLPDSALQDNPQVS